MAIVDELHSTTISKLIIRAPSHVQNRVRRELQQADWPDGSSEQIVFVRRLSATATSSHIGRHLVEKARRQIFHPDAGENVVRFANRLEMLATLLSDIAGGTAVGRWYWRRWSQLFAKTISKALYSVLADNLTSINALTEILARRRQLTTVWQSLAEEEAEQLIQEIIWQNGYASSQTISTATTDTPEVTTIQPVIPQRLFRRWHDVPAAEPASHRLRLAALLIAQEHAPIALFQKAESIISAIAIALKERLKHEQPLPPASATWLGESSSTPEAMARPTIPSEEQTPPSPHELPESEKAQQVDAEPAPDAQGLLRREDARGNKAATRSNNEHTGPGAAKKTADRLQPLPERVIAGEAEAAHDPPHPFKQVKVDQSAPRQEPDTGKLPEFYTEQGGVLYLLNFLNRSDLQAIVNDHRQQLQSGWIWLYRVAELLDFNVMDPMAAFLAEQIGLDSCDELVSLPPLPERERIETLAEQWYGRTEVWNPDLLWLPARIVHNVSHLDMYCDLMHVRLELRLAGLDINPGWLPWLGRVVQFHFDYRGGASRE